MKVRIEYIQSNEKEIVIRCREEDEEIKQIKALIDSRFQKLTGICENQTYLFIPGEVYYFESVDNRVFAYLNQKVCSIPYSLEKLEKILENQGFFRSSKGMILNMNYIKKFQSSIGNRIIATMENGENVIVSRHYAKMLRAYLKEGRENE